MGYKNLTKKKSFTKHKKAAFSSTKYKKAKPILSLKKYSFAYKLLQRQRKKKRKFYFLQIARAKAREKLSNKSIYKKPKPKRFSIKRLQTLMKGKPASTQLNINFYKSADGIYTSYWLGKFINTLLESGKKKTVSKYIYKAFSQIKYVTTNNALTLFLEMLDKIKPTFRLRNYIVRRTVIKEFPISVLRPRKLILAVHWFKDDVRAKFSKFGVSISNEIMYKLLDFKLNPKKNTLVKKRNEFIKRTIKAQFNIRYNFGKKY